MSARQSAVIQAVKYLSRGDNVSLFIAVNPEHIGKETTLFDIIKISHPQTKFNFVDNKEIAIVEDVLSGKISPYQGYELFMGTLPWVPSGRISEHPMLHLLAVALKQSKHRKKYWDDPLFTERVLPRDGSYHSYRKITSSVTDPTKESPVPEEGKLPLKSCDGKSKKNVSFFTTSPKESPVQGETDKQLLQCMLENNEMTKTLWNNILKDMSGQYDAGMYKESFSVLLKGALQKLLIHSSLTDEDRKHADLLITAIQSRENLSPDMFVSSLKDFIYTMQPLPLCTGPVSGLLQVGFSFFISCKNARVSMSEENLDAPHPSPGMG